MSPDLKLELYYEIPIVADIEERYRLEFKFKNISGTIFPGGHIFFQMRWSELGDDMRQQLPLEISALPDNEFTEPFEFYQTEQLPGITYIVFTAARCEGEVIKIHLPNGNHLPESQIFHSIRIRSKEEILQERLIQVIQINSDATDRLTTRLTYLSIGVALFIALIQVVLPILLGV